MAIVDQWKQVNPARTYAQHCQSLDVPVTIGADPDGLCGFQAIVEASVALGLTRLVTMADVNSFSVCAAVSPSRTVWKLLFRFVQERNRCTRAVGDAEICEYSMKLNQRRNVGFKDDVAAHIEHAVLAPGVYLCAGLHPPPRRVSRTFVLEVTTRGMYATDGDARRVPLRPSLLCGWLGSSSSAASVCTTPQTEMG